MGKQQSRRYSLDIGERSAASIFEFESLPVERALGAISEVEADAFRFGIIEGKKVSNRREILSFRISSM